MNILLSLSGGLDSTTLLAWLLSQNHKVSTVFFNYGSKHNLHEMKAAKDIANHYLVPNMVWNMKDVFEGFNSALLINGGEIPEGHYNDATMSQTVVPCRNMIFISTLAGFAESKNFNSVALAIHGGDHRIYPDCRPTFFYAMKDAVHHGTDGKITLMAPFLNMDKTEVVKEGLNLKVPYELTRTCYKDQEQACGKCGSCRERLEAFNLNDAVDPILYTK